MLKLLGFLAFLTTLGWSASFDTVKPEAFLDKGFPLGIGSQWVYVHIDSSAIGYSPQRTEQVLVETVTVTVVRQTSTAEGRTTSMWIREFGSKIDTQYVTLFGDTVSFSVRLRIYTDTTKPLVEQEVTRFVFPLKVGSTWKGSVPYVRDTLRSYP